MRKYLFIDGASFEAALSAICAPIFPDSDILEIINFTFVADDYQRVFYYDSLPAKKDNQSSTDYTEAVARKQRFFDRINQAPRSHVRGAFSKYNRRFKRQEQKGVDVLLAIDVLQNAYQGNMDNAVIITSDLDFMPLFDALIQTKVSSELVYENGSVTKELIESADISHHIKLETVGRWLKKPFSEKLRILSIGSGMPHHQIDILEEKEKVISEHKILYGKVKSENMYVAIIDRGSDVSYVLAGGLEVLDEHLEERFAERS